MLPLLFNNPSSERDWNIWSLSHQASHRKIAQAIQGQKGVALQEYQLDPIYFGAFDDFLDRNQQAHNDMLGALGISGSDLQRVDIKNTNQKRAWIFLHASEHRNAERALGV